MKIAIAIALAVVACSALAQDIGSGRHGEPTAAEEEAAREGNPDKNAPCQGFVFPETTKAIADANAKLALDCQARDNAAAQTKDKPNPLMALITWIFAIIAIAFGWLWEVIRDIAAGLGGWGNVVIIWLLLSILSTLNTIARK
jgi:hypothetical protein